MNEKQPLARTKLELLICFQERDINDAQNIWVKSVSRILETLGDSPSGINTCALLT
jgi:hypothetical protein